MGHERDGDIRVPASGAREALEPSDAVDRATAAEVLREPGRQTFEEPYVVELG